MMLMLWYCDAKTLKLHAVAQGLLSASLKLLKEWALERSSKLTRARP